MRLSGNKKKIYIFFPDFSCICIISTPLTFCAFSKLPPPPKIKPLKKLHPLPPGRNKRSVPKWKINVPTHGDLCSIVPMR